MISSAVETGTRNSCFALPRRMMPISTAKNNIKASSATNLRPLLFTLLMMVDTPQHKQKHKNVRKLTTKKLKTNPSIIYSSFFHKNYYRA